MSEEMITCQVPGCGESIHVVSTHIKKHEGWDEAKYIEAFPAAPLLSRAAEEALARRAKSAGTEPASAVVATPKAAATSNFFHDVFGFKSSNKDAMSPRGTPIPIDVHDRAALPEAVAMMIPDPDPDYVFDPGMTKTVVMALTMKIPVYLWGHAGVGKSSLFENVCARMNRGYIRVNHTANMEEADVEGRYVVNAAGEMVFENGPLVDAMEQGLVYCADEYDFAPPMVLSVYQAVLEGKPLFIKAANKKVLPHPNFRFVATGNTNGAGDETGLYQGTMMQNAANYERFGVVERVDYMPAKSEIEIITRKTSATTADAETIVKFANAMRDAYDKRDVASPMSPRSTLMAARLGAARANMKFGITVAYINRLPALSAEVARQTLNRIFGS